MRLYEVGKTNLETEVQRGFRIVAVSRPEGAKRLRVQRGKGAKSSAAELIEFYPKMLQNNRLRN